MRTQLEKLSQFLSDRPKFQLFFDFHNQNFALFGKRKKEIYCAST